MGPQGPRPRSPLQPQGIHMNEKSQPEQKLEPEVVDLGDVKALTMGPPALAHLEDNPILMARRQ
jgi:hypothetical protein